MNELKSSPSIQIWGGGGGSLPGSILFRFCMYTRPLSGVMAKTLPYGVTALSLITCLRKILKTERRIACECSESAWEWRIALYKRNHHHHHPFSQLQSSSDDKIFRLPTFKTRHGKQRSFSFQDPRIWNKVPHNIIYLSTSSTVKSHFFKLHVSIYITVLLNTYAKSLCVFALHGLHCLSHSNHYIMYFCTSSLSAF